MVCQKGAAVLGSGGRWTDREKYGEQVRPRGEEGEGEAGCEADCEGDAIGKESPASWEGYWGCRGQEARLGEDPARAAEVRDPRDGEACHGGIDVKETQPTLNTDKEKREMTWKEEKGEAIPRQISLGPRSLMLPPASAPFRKIT